MRERVRCVVCVVRCRCVERALTPQAVAVAMPVAVAGGPIPHSHITLRPFSVLPTGMGASQALAKVLSQPGLSDIVKLVQVRVLQ